MYSTPPRYYGIDGTISSAYTQPIQSSSSEAHLSPSDNKMGIYVGVPLSIALAITLAIIAWLFVKTRKTNHGQKTQYELPVGVTAQHKQPGYEQTNALYALLGEMLYGNYMRTELGNGR
jgi:hypothetical protein